MAADAVAIAEVTAAERAIYREMIDLDYSALERILSSVHGDCAIVSGFVDMVVGAFGQAKALIHLLFVFVWTKEGRSMETELPAGDANPMIATTHFSPT